jgi:phosphatidylglycerophosphate synthase
MDAGPPQALHGKPGERNVARRARPHAANAITLLRVLAMPAFVWTVWRAHTGSPSAAPALLFFLAAASDLADGPVARRLGAATETGRLVDHVADIAFLTTALTTYWGLGVVPWFVPAAVLASFLFYVADSWWQRGRRVPRRLVGSRLGHLGGIFNYAVVGVIACNESSGLGWLPPGVVWALFAAVPVYSGAAVVSRLLARVPTRRRALD